MLEVEFENPIAYFDKLVAFAHLSARSREDFYESRDGRYAADAADLLFNGPFMLASWVHGAQHAVREEPERTGTAPRIQARRHRHRRT